MLLYLDGLFCHYALKSAIVEKKAIAIPPSSTLKLGLHRQGSYYLFKNMKVYALCLLALLFSSLSCSDRKVTFSEADTVLISTIFQENQKLHEGLLLTPPRLSTDGIAASTIALSQSQNPRLLEWKTQLLETIPKNPKDLEGSYTDLSKMALVLVEMKKEVPMKETFHQFYCPMVEKYWVAKEKEVRNPYAPDMRDCGDLVTED